MRVCVPNLFHWPVSGKLASISHPTCLYLLLAIAWAWFVNHLPFVKCQILPSCSTLTAHRGSGPRSRCANRIPFRNRSFVQKPTEPPHFFPRSLSLSPSKENMQWASELNSKSEIPVLIMIPVVFTTEQSQRSWALQCLKAMTLQVIK